MILTVPSREPATKRRPSGSSARHITAWLHRRRFVVLADDDEVGDSWLASPRRCVQCDRAQDAAIVDVEKRDGGVAPGLKVFSWEGDTRMSWDGDAWSPSCTALASRVKWEAPRCATRRGR